MLSRLYEIIRQRHNRKKIYSTSAYWDSKADAYDDTSISMWPNQALNYLYENEQKELIDRYLENVSGKSLLDLGCGSGRLSRWFAGQGARVTGVDFSAGTLAVAAKQSSSDNPTYRRDSVFELADEDSYDVVFTWGVLTIACLDKDQLRDALVRIRRALRTDGGLLLLEPIHRGFLHRVLDLDLNEFLAVVREAGFEIQATAPLHFWPMRLALCYIPWPAWITEPLYRLGQAAMKIPGLSRLGDYWAILAYPVSSPNSNIPSGKEGA